MLVSRPKTACIFMIDRTGSMGRWIDALNKCLPSVVQSFAATHIFDHLAILSYSDYDLPVAKVCEFSGYKSVTDVADVEALCNFAGNIRLEGGGGHPEAVRSALLRIADESYEGRAYIMHLCDAPPHDENNPDNEGKKERDHLGELFRWENCVAKLTGAHDKVRYTCLSTCSSALYASLAAVTSGDFHALAGNVTATNIRIQIGHVLSGWIGLPDAATGRLGLSSLITTGVELSRATTIQLPGPPTACTVLAANLGRAVSKLRVDKEYAAAVAVGLELIIATDPMALTVSPVLGKIWREFCKRRGDPKRDELIEALHKAKHRINDKDERSVLEEWLKESYNMTSEIEESLRNFTAKNGVKGLVRFVPEDESLCAQQMVQLLANSDIKATAIIRAILSRMKIEPEFSVAPNERAAATSEEAAATTACADDDEEQDDALPFPDRSIPLNLPIHKIFDFVMHTVAPGTKLTRRYGAILAIHAICCGSVLSKLALEFLEHVRGRWINWRRKPDDETPEVPENFSRAFLHLILDERVVATALTEDERATANHYQTVADAMRFYHSLEVDVELIDGTSIDGCFPDHTITCIQCDKMRPLCLITPDGVCGYCKKGQGEIEPAVDPSSVKQVRCYTCGSIFARRKDVQIPGHSKCHGCQHLGAPAPSTRCGKCGLRFVQFFRPDAGLPKGWCGACAAGVENRVVKMRQLRGLAHQLFPKAEHFKALCQLAGVTCNAEISASTPLFKAVLCISRLEKSDANALCVAKGDAGSAHARELLHTAFEEDLDRISFRDTQVQNVEAILSYVLGIMLGANPRLSECALCLEDLPSSKLMMACGRKGCVQRLCAECHGQWYGKNAPGTLVYPRALSCALCARRPAPQCIARVSQRLVAFVGHVASRAEPVDEGLYYAWCRRCNRASEVGRKECGDGALPPLPADGYVCEACRQPNRTGATATAAADTTAEVALCPNAECGVAIHKVSGCNHIECPVCNTHWCWECRAVCDSDEATYTHMWAEHGRIFDTDEPENIHEEEDEEDDA